ncbi:hypothetical protein D3Z58_15460 [Clostridiaceae bacterium]|nr:hypothetical protein [Clostridiaceae bacterium]
MNMVVFEDGGVLFWGMGVNLFVLEYKTKRLFFQGNMDGRNCFLGRTRQERLFFRRYMVKGIVF